MEYRLTDFRPGDLVILKEECLFDGEDGPARVVACNAEALAGPVLIIQFLNGGGLDQTIRENYSNFKFYDASLKLTKVVPAHIKRRIRAEKRSLPEQVKDALLHGIPLDNDDLT